VLGATFATKQASNTFVYDAIMTNPVPAQEQQYCNKARQSQTSDARATEETKGRNEWEAHTSLKPLVTDLWRYGSMLGRHHFSHRYTTTPPGHTRVVPLQHLDRFFSQ